MAINKYYFKKWFLMLIGKSVNHAPQKVGRFFSVNQVSGYYNDLTKKVKMQPKYLNIKGFPDVEKSNGERCVFPVSIFQYSLGSYDLFLKTGNKKYLDKFVEGAKWAIDNQLTNGAWDNFSAFYKDHPYGAMCQGEGASLMLRYYAFSNEKDYLSASIKAIKFMCSSLENGGTTFAEKDNLIFLEYTNKRPVLNGWIFAIFGVYDLWLTTKEAEYSQLFLNSIKSLKLYLPQFDCGYWSYYDLDKRIASPFYHKLHIAQLKALLFITNDGFFEHYIKLFEKYNSNIFLKLKAFFVKAAQKIKE